MAVDTNTAERWAEEDAEKPSENGRPEASITLELNAMEVELLHNVLTNASFPAAVAKQVAASIQIKLEQAAQ